MRQWSLLRTLLPLLLTFLLLLVVTLIFSPLLLVIYHLLRLSFSLCLHRRLVSPTGLRRLHGTLQWQSLATLQRSPCI